MVGGNDLTSVLYNIRGSVILVLRIFLSASSAPQNICNDLDWKPGIWLEHRDQLVAFLFELLYRKFREFFDSGERVYQKEAIWNVSCCHNTEDQVVLHATKPALFAIAARHRREWSLWKVCKRFCVFSVYESVEKTGVCTICLELVSVLKAQFS